MVAQAAADWASGSGRGLPSVGLGAQRRLPGGLPSLMPRRRRVDVASIAARIVDNCMVGRHPVQGQECRATVTGLRDPQSPFDWGPGGS